MGQPHKHAEVVASYSRVNVSSLSGPALDWAVAKCESKKVTIQDGYVGSRNHRHDYDVGTFDWYQPHKNWAQGGPIIERERLIIQPNTSSERWFVGKEYDYDWMMEGEQAGDTLLIAAMRCYVASKMGDVIEIPEELV